VNLNTDSFYRLKIEKLEHLEYAQFLVALDGELSTYT